jgi:hypothetical protein
MFGGKASGNKQDEHTTADAALMTLHITDRG